MQAYQYAVWVKKVAPLKLFSVKFCQCIASFYPHIFTNFGQFIFLFNEMALIFQGVLIVYNVS